MRRLFYYLAFVMMLGLTACHHESHQHANKEIFRYNEATGLVNLDPAFARDQAHSWVCNQLYNGLVQLDDSLHVRPSIARHWIVSADGKTYTFYLRKDVYFHTDSVFHGKKRRVVAADFVYSLRRLASPKTASPGAWVLDNVVDSPAGKAVSALNDSVLQIKLKHAFPPFLGMLSMPYCSVVPWEAVLKYGEDFRKHPVGTGPFFLKNWVENIKMVLQKNPDYFEFDHGHRLPYLDAISIRFLIEKMSAFMEFAKGNLDFLSGLAPAYKDELLTRDGKLRGKYRKNFYMLKSPYLNTEYLGILVDTSLKVAQESPLKNIAIRKAINYGFDRVKMIKFLRNGIGIPGTKGIIPPGLPAFDSTSSYGYDYQPKKARRLLHDAGYSLSNPIPPITLSTTADYVDLCKFVQSQLNDVGFDIRLNVIPNGSLRSLKAQSKLPFFRASWIADYPNEENYLSLFYSKNFTPQGPNYTHFSSPTFDALYKKSALLRKESQRRKIYRQMDSLMMTQSPVVILYYDEAVRFVAKRVKGMHMNPINMLNLKRVRIVNEGNH